MNSIADGVFEYTLMFTSLREVTKGDKLYLEDHQFKHVGAGGIMSGLLRGATRTIYQVSCDDAYNPLNEAYTDLLRKCRLLKSGADIPLGFGEDLRRVAEAISGALVEDRGLDALRNTYADTKNESKWKCLAENLQETLLPKLVKWAARLQGSHDHPSKEELKTTLRVYGHEVVRLRTSFAYLESIAPGFKSPLPSVVDPDAGASPNSGGGKGCLEEDLVGVEGDSVLGKSNA